ncbi:SIR2 family protein [Gallibacterium anatis]|uniref:SIR2 family protein n=1 Tax=Gallibacterium anatis TaxID=750 RepID=UPI0005312627|nr:SIR2 family protein [Gallibacterium anatis]KGQ42088.1 hypothetical protein JP30_02505 [Gallibacterium anatis IPDH697-78]
MNILDFIKNFHNHPVLFVGTGFSLRYLKNSYSWNNLLETIDKKIHKTDIHYLDLKDEFGVNNYPVIAEEIEKSLSAFLKNNQAEEFKTVNEKFYQALRNGEQPSRLKIYISELLSDLTKKEEDKLQEEITLLKKARKNIGSIITTNYDLLIEDIFKFNPLIANNILLSNPYGSVYKIHGCITQPNSIIIKDSDYKEFEKRYELIRAQLLSIFIHNPIVFIGYSINDPNITAILKTIFSYVEPNSEQANKIKDNFLLVEYEQGSNSEMVGEHDIILENGSTIRINKIKTDNYGIIYEGISNLMLPVSVMDIRKVKNIVAEITSGANIQVRITEDLDELSNDAMLLAIGSSKTITYAYQTKAEMMENYFQIVEEENIQLLKILDKQSPNIGQYFPIFAFSKIYPEIQNFSKYADIQKDKLKENINNPKGKISKTFTCINDIINSEIPDYKKEFVIISQVYIGNITLDDLRNYLTNLDNKKDTKYRKLLCLYDYMAHNTDPLV